VQLWEAHLVVADLQRARPFYEGVLGLSLAHAGDGVRFYWLDEGHSAMLGLWQQRAQQPPGPPTTPDLTRVQPQHLAFAVALPDLFARMERLRQQGVALWGAAVPAGAAPEPVVHAWVPAASIYFQDSDGHCLEFLAVLPDPPQAEAGAVPWSLWRRRTPTRGTLPRSPDTSPDAPDPV
jgi:lactoylglutathione lyase